MGKSTKNRKKVKTSSRKEFNYMLIPVTCVLGVIAWVIGNGMYNACIEKWPRCILIGVIFTILFVMLSIGVLIFSNMCRAFEENVLTGKKNGQSVLGMLGVAVIGMLLLASLLQLIYSLEGKKEAKEPTSYIFIIDDSGSTAQSDPQTMRYTAIKEVLEQVDDSFPYMVYAFADQTQILREMAPVSDGGNDFTGYSAGGTAIKGVLGDVLGDYRNHKWDGGEFPKVILLSDGSPTDFILFHSIRNLLKEYCEEGISISTVGFSQVNESIMKRIADATGGVFVQVDKISELAEAMKNAATQSAIRDLFSYRYTVKHDFLYAVLRVLFLFILGNGIGMGAALAYGNHSSKNLILVSTLVKSFFGALFMEIAINGVGFNSKVSWFILWICISLTIGYKPKKQKIASTSPINEPEIGGQGTGIITEEEPLDTEIKHYSQKNNGDRKVRSLHGIDTDD